MTACDAFVVHKGTSVWMLKAFLWDPAKETLIMRVTSPKKVGKDKYG